MALPATESFTDSNGTQLTDHSASWTLNDGDFDVQSNALANDSGGDAAAHMAHWNADSFNDDQYAECVIVAAPGTGYHYLGVAVRCAVVAHTGYFFFVVPERTGVITHYLTKVIAGSTTDLATQEGPEVEIASVLRQEAEGTTLTCLVDDADPGSLSPQTDAAISSGAAGISGWDHSSGDRTLTRIDDWEGGNLGAAGLSIPVAMHHYMHQTG